MAQTGPEGHWDGVIKLPDREMPFAIDLAKSAKGDWIGSFGVPAQKLTGVEISKIQAEGKNVSFLVSGLPNKPEFTCTLDGAELACDVKTAEGAVVANLKRTGEAKVELPATSPAVSKEVEGDWEGAIQTPNGPLGLILHLVNQPDKTVKGTVDSPAQNATGLVLSSIAQTPTTLEFKLQMVNGSYKGTINKTSTEIAGEWTQGGKSSPLNFVKKAK
jgi:hypothetical protein